MTYCIPFNHRIGKPRSTTLTRIWCKNMTRIYTNEIRFGTLQALKFIKLKGNKSYWLFKCDCRNEYIQHLNDVKQKKFYCDCSQKTGIHIKYNNNRALRKTHRIWKELIEKHKYKVCKKWRDSFEDFTKDLGRKPDGDYFVDLIDKKGLFCKENCEWFTYISIEEIKDDIKIFCDPSYLPDKYNY